MLNIMASNDARYDGRFYVGVLSTGIYCLPSCKAKLPKPENIRFFETREEAIASGLRGCKRCRSEKYPDRLPEWMHSLIAYITKHPKQRLTENALMKLTGVEISTIRRYFKDQHNITPLAFHRRIRLQHALSLIKTGTNYLEAGWASGWESPSGFRQAFKQQFGITPGKVNGHV